MKYTGDDCHSRANRRWHRRPCWIFLCFALFAGATQTRAQYLRIVAYNIEADIDDVTAPRNGLYTVLEAIGQQRSGNVQQPIDILALEETTSNSLTVAPIVTALNAYYGAGVYAAATYQGTQRGSNSSGNGPNALIYNTRTVSLVLQSGADGVGVSGTPSKTGGAYRQVIRYEFVPVGAPAATFFYVYVSHMKSSYGGTTTAILAARNAEAQLIRADIATLPAGAGFLSMGDFNLDGSYEDAYQTLTTNGPLVDSLNFNPQDNDEEYDLAAYKAIMTDSSTSLHYRDDIQFMAPAILYATSAYGLQYVPGSCRAFGNNGTTALGKSTNLSSNTALNTNFQGPITASTALAALTTGSDHLPLVADYFVASPYATWKSQHFNAAELLSSAISGDNADPDGDGIPNLLEYALGLDARTPNATGQPAPSQVIISGNSYQTLTFTRVIANTDISYVPQVSGDLLTWNSGSSYLTTVSAVNNADGSTQTITVRDNTAMSAFVSKRFMRLQVVRATN